MRRIGLILMTIAGLAMVLQAGPVKAQLVSGDDVVTVHLAMYCKELSDWKRAEDLLETDPKAVVRMFPDDPAPGWTCRSGLVGVAGVVSRAPTTREIIFRGRIVGDIDTVQVLLDGGLTVFGPHASFQKVR